jgi:hypothetical protein
MTVLYFLADAFINTFGITQPSEAIRKRAAFFILALIIVTVAIAVVAFLVIHSVMR